MPNSDSVLLGNEIPAASGYRANHDKLDKKRKKLKNLTKNQMGLAKRALTERMAPCRTGIKKMTMEDKQFLTCREAIASDGNMEEEEKEMVLYYGT